MFWDVVLDGLLDSIKLLPFLFAIYVVIELIEKSEKAKHKAVKLLNGKLSPLVAGGVGIIPQCGFSVMATNLYVQDYLKTGTLIAFFVATSDEALPLLLSNSQTVGVVWKVVLIKFVYAVVLGYVINLFDKRTLTSEYVEVHDEGCCHHHLHDEKKGFWNFIKHPVLHTVKVFLYIFVVNTLFGLLLYFVGEDKVGEFLLKFDTLQPVFASLIGLIPNCGSSVVLTGLYSQVVANRHVLSFPSLISGLVSNSGIALAVLFADKKHVKRNLVVLAVVFISAVLIGYVLTLFAILW